MVEIRMGKSEGLFGYQSGLVVKEIVGIGMGNLISNFCH